jgi:hypothetical protein
VKGCVREVFADATGEKQLLGEEQRENAETFGERHTDDGLNEDFARGAGIATDGFGGFGADKTDADGGAEKTECASDVAGDTGGCYFSEDRHGYIYWLVGVPPCALVGTLPTGKGLVMGFGVAGFVSVLVAMIADEADVNGAEQREDGGLNQTD